MSIVEASSTEAQLAHPLQRRYLAHTKGRLVLPELAYLNQQAQLLGVQTGAGHPLCFAEPDGTTDYERRAFESGFVATRLNNWHDAFNALVWLAFPLTKAALNRAHLESQAMSPLSNNQSPKQRSRIGDRLTQFDECGVVVVGGSASAFDLWQGICHHEWIDVFVHRRAELLATTRFVVFGHGSLDALRAPFVGLCGKAVFVAADADEITAIDAGDLSGVDRRLQQRIATTNWAEFENHLTSPDSPSRSLQPLPLLGIPGATTDNEHPDYYRDQRQFRRRVAM